MKYTKYILDTYAKFFAKTRYYKINQFLFSLSLRGLGIYNCQNFFISGELNFLKKHLSKINSPIILDVGAHKGAYALLCKQINNQAKIFCFEPNPKTFAILNDETKGCGIMTINQALSDSRGKLLLYDYMQNDRSTHATLCKDVIEQVHKEKSINFEVDVSTVDNFIQENNLKNITLLKIDVEGHEIEVLKGAKKSLDRGVIDAIQFEFTQINSTSRVFMKDFFDLLQEKYDFYRMLPFELVLLGKYNPTFHEIFGYQNIVCLRKNLNNV
jgi:FkbM family methyltransferase